MVMAGGVNISLILVIIIIIKVFVKCKILSIETILSAYTRTHTRTTLTSLMGQTNATVLILPLEAWAFCVIIHEELRIVFLTVSTCDHFLSAP